MIEWTSIISVCNSLYPFSLYLFVFSAVINNRLNCYINRLLFFFCFCLVIWLAFWIDWKSFILSQVFMKIVWKQFTPPLVVAIKSNNWHQEQGSWKLFKFFYFWFVKILMADKSFFGEGASLNKPPLFYGQNYPIWWIRMKFFIQSLDKNIWNVISNNTYVRVPPW